MAQKEILDILENEPEKFFTSKDILKMLGKGTSSVYPRVYSLWHYGFIEQHDIKPKSKLKKPSMYEYRISTARVCGVCGMSLKMAKFKICQEIKGKLRTCHLKCRQVLE